jgi:PAS domain S-box-containing protein
MDPTDSTDTGVLQNSTSDRLRLIIDTIPGFVWSAAPDGSIEFLNQRGLEYSGFSLDQIRGWNWKDINILHHDDLQGLFEKWRDIVASGEPGEIQARMRRFDGEYRWFLFRVAPLYDDLGRLVAWWGIDVEINERKNAEDLLAGEKRLLEMVAKGEPLASVLNALCRIVEEATGDSLCSILLMDGTGQLRHGAAPSLPPDYVEWVNGRDIAGEEGPCASAAFLRAPIIVDDVHLDNRWPEEYRQLALAHGLRSCWSTPIISLAGAVLGTFALYSRKPGIPTAKQEKLIEQFSHLASIAIERKQSEDALRRSKAYLVEAQRLSHTGSFGWKPSDGEVFWSQETYRIFDFEQTTKPTVELIIQRIHPDDRDSVRHAFEQAFRDGTNLDFEHRLELPDGAVKHLHVVARAAKNEAGQLEFVGAVSDVTSLKQADEKLRQNEREFRQIVEAIPMLIIVMAPDGSYLYANERLLEYTGHAHEDVVAGDFRERVFHPDDIERLQEERRLALTRGLPFEMEQRVRRKDGQYRWFLTKLSPLKDEQGRVIRWYATGTDIEDRKRVEERIQNENIALREEIDKTSMFEEIVGSSAPLQKVLSRVAKVAPMDSTVLITGETGTGKELIARAIHKRSPRCGRAFVSVNCAAIPPSLIASELFGHEKGAFTGALQRRLGRFEMAEGGTIFLDEIGELPTETQIALLRVLQENEFERVGGSQSIQTDVRVIAATNRDLPTAIEAGTFRNDLFYRLNVFPIEVPPLRERKEDIRLLVEYFIDRYASKFGKKIRSIDKQTLGILQSYSWPGNIRELQNVIERSVILTETETLALDESWLSREPVIVPPANQQLSKKIMAQEKEIIEAALAESKGRISGPSGAAAKLSLPPSTLESKIRTLKINKHRFKTTQ